VCVSVCVSVSICLPVTQHEAWPVDVADALKASLQEAKAEAQRVRDCQAQLSRQHQVLQAALHLPHH
jgi:hypothetical protein